MEALIGIGIWVVIFLVWYCRTYPAKVKGLLNITGMNMQWPRKKKTATVKAAPRAGSGKDFRVLVETIETICARDSFTASEAATMVQAVKQLNDIEPHSGQVWEAYALDSLETAKISCDDCRILVGKTVKKTGVRIECPKCRKWLALKNSKVTVIDPSRSDLEDWEK
jgi:hypothetical protein